MTSEYGTRNERLEVAGRLYIALCAQYPGRFITLLAAATWRPKLEGNGRSAAAHARYFLARLSCPQAAPRAKRDWFQRTKQVAS
jgi:hypothetical protein